MKRLFFSVTGGIRYTFSTTSGNSREWKSHGNGFDQKEKEKGTTEKGRRREIELLPRGGGGINVGNLDTCAGPCGDMVVEIKSCS